MMFMGLATESRHHKFNDTPTPQHKSHDLLLFGPALIIVVSYAGYCLMWGVVGLVRPRTPKTLPVSRWKRFVPNIAVWIFSTFLLLVVWVVNLKLTYTPDPPGRYIPLSQKPLPFWLVISVWTLTPITILVWFYAVRDLIVRRR